MKKVLLITDNEELLSRFKELVLNKGLENHHDFEFHYAYSHNNKTFQEKYGTNGWIRPVNVKTETPFLIKEYEIIFSLHCKQIFPDDLVKNVKCINIHPGLNPYNRGWYPQIFSIINRLPCGATIHLIDNKLDHGPIICQKEIKIEPWDTSLTAYNKILDAEIELLSESFENILKDNYQTFTSEEGNLNLKKDFNNLCEIDLMETDTFLNHINKLRALTHGNYANAYFKDDNGNKIYLKLELKKE